MQDLKTLAQYPFLNDAKTYIKENGPSIDDLLNNVFFERARSIGVERIDQALTKRTTGTRSMATESDYIMELLSYPIARMIAVCIGDTYFKRRYALAEAYRTYRDLLKENASFLLTVADELNLQIQPEEDTQKNTIFFKDYLCYAPTRYKEWKMINRDMHNGYIAITHKDLARIIQETLRKRINDELDHHQCNPAVTKTFKEDIKRIQNIIQMKKKKMEAYPVGQLNTIFLPPCMKDILAAIQTGENVPHMGRFALVAFLSSLKLSPQQILRLFSTAPDFEEDKTRYQIEHITGKSSATQYSSPGCEKMKTYGICPVEKIDDICKTIRHPQSYYKKRWKQEKKKP